MLETAYIIVWRYSDGSGSGATAAFVDKARAERLLELLKQDMVREYRVEAVPFDSASGVKVHAAPQGWKLVPINPTPDMLKAGMDRNGDVIRVGDGQGVPAELWRDMLNAAPEPPSSPDAWAWEEVPEQRCEHGVPWGSDCTTCGVTVAGHHPFPQETPPIPEEPQSPTTTGGEKE